MVVCRDVLLVAFAASHYLTGQQRQVQPLMISKINTVAQILLVIVVLGHAAMSYFPAGLSAPLSWLVAVTTMASALAYLSSWRRVGAFRRRPRVR